MRRASAALALLALGLTLVPSAAAHGGGGALGFRSKVLRFQPATAGLTARVLDEDDRLELTNRTGQTVTVIGYDSEPYLRFDAGGGVEVNRNSPADALNSDRYGEVQVPASAKPDATPRWERVADGHVYAWHDHRIHWMSTVLPAKVRAAEREPHHVFDWKVPLDVGTQRVMVIGRLDYEPPNQSRSWALYLGLGAVPLIVLAGAVLLVRRRRVGPATPAR